jgi:4-hydroxybutyrate CoA-transferase
VKVGIKYCGGCNSRFERIAIAEKIKSDYKNFEFSYAKENQEYDFIIVINGCHIACAGLHGLNSKKGFIIIRDDDYKNIKARIDKIL